MALVSSLTWPGLARDFVGQFFCAQPWRFLEDEGTDTPRQHLSRNEAHVDNSRTPGTQASFGPLKTNHQLSGGENESEIAPEVGKGNLRGGVSTLWAWITYPFQRTKRFQKMRGCSATNPPGVSS